MDSLILDLLNESKSKDTKEKEYKVRKTITVNNKMQKNYKYDLVMPEGDLSDLQSEFPEFKPYYTPKQMLEMGVFEGKYFRDCHNEYPSSWFSKAKEAKDEADPSINYFGVKSRKPLSEWRKNGWIIGNDPRGWAEWYFRMYYGRRDPEVDKKQIKRWLSFKRHQAQVKLNCKVGDKNCRPVQRQALLQWSYKCDI